MPLSPRHQEKRIYRKKDLPGAPTLKAAPSLGGDRHGACACRQYCACAPASRTKPLSAGGGTGGGHRLTRTQASCLHPPHRRLHPTFPLGSRAYILSKRKRGTLQPRPTRSPEQRDKGAGRCDSLPPHPRIGPLTGRPACVRLNFLFLCPEALAGGLPKGFQTSPLQPFLRASHAGLRTPLSPSPCRKDGERPRSNASGHPPQRAFLASS